MKSTNNVELQEQSSLSLTLLSNSLDHQTKKEDSLDSLQHPTVHQPRSYAINAKNQLENQAEAQLSQQSNVIKHIIRLYEESLSLTTKPYCFVAWIPILKPKQMLLWKLFISLIVLYLFFEIPVYIFYGPKFWRELTTEQELFQVYFTLAGILMIDMVLQFITAYYKHGNLITDRKKVAKHYLKGYFAFDLIAIILSLLRLSLATSKYRFLFLFFYFKLPSLLQTDRQIGEIVLLHRNLRICYQVSKMIIFMLFCFNVFSCVFYQIGTFMMGRGYNSWLNNDGNFGLIMERPIYQQYFFSYYYSLGTVSTTMGYGDITPMNIAECSWALTGIMFAVMVFALNINNFQLLMEEYNSYNIKRFRFKVSINKFMAQKNVPSEMQERVRQYLNEYWYEQGSRDQEIERQVFSYLAPELKYCKNSVGAFLQRTMFADHFSRIFLRELAQMTLEVSYPTGDYVIFDQANALMEDQSYYYILSGIILMQPGNQNLVSKKLTCNQYFGEWAFFTGFPRTATAQALVYSQLYKLSRADFLEVVSKFPDEYEKFCEIRDTLLFAKQISCVGQQCWTCSSNDHYAVNCPFMHYKPPAQNLIENDTVLDQRQPRMEIARFNRKQWPTRANAQVLVKGLDKKNIQKKLSQMLKTQKLINMFKSAKKSKTGAQASEQSEKYQIRLIRTDSQEQLAPERDINAPEISQGEQAPPSPQGQKKTEERLESEGQLKLGENLLQEQSVQMVRSSQEPSPLLEKSNKQKQKLEELKAIQQPYIHIGLDNFDVPANFKNYFKKFNSSNFKAFKGLRTQETTNKLSEIQPQKFPQQAQFRQTIAYRNTIKP